MCKFQNNECVNFRIMESGETNSIQYCYSIGQVPQRKEFLNFYLMKTKMKVCQVRHLLGPVPQAKGQQLFNYCPSSFNPNSSQTHDQIFAAQFHSVHHHDYQPNHKRP